MNICDCSFNNNNIIIWTTPLKESMMKVMNEREDDKMRKSRRWISGQGKINYKTKEEGKIAKDLYKSER